MKVVAKEMSHLDDDADCVNAQQTPLDALAGDARRKLAEIDERIAATAQPAADDLDVAIGILEGTHVAEANLMAQREEFRQQLAIHERAISALRQLKSQFDAAAAAGDIKRQAELIQQVLRYGDVGGWIELYRRWGELDRFCTVVANWAKGSRGVGGPRKFGPFDS